jgi:RNA polymerase sigma-70 factor, ECF subfamily
MADSPEQSGVGAKADAGLPADPRTAWLLKHAAWLRVLARQELNQRFTGKLDPSDIVQQTLLEAWQGWERLQARAEPQRRVWLKQILAHQLAKFVRHYQGTQKRDLTRELAIDASLDRSDARLEQMLQGREPSPSAAAMQQEQRLELAQALETLPEDYREVIQLRNLEELTHAQVAERMQRSEAAVRMLWLRALAELGKAMQVGQRP